MKNIGKKIFATITTVAMMISTLPSFAINASAATEIKDGTYWLSPKCATDSCMDVSGGEVLYNGYSDDIHLWQYLGNGNQQFIIEYINTVDNEHYYFMKNVLTGEYVDSDGSNVFEAPGNGSHSQRWRFIDAGNGYYTLINKFYGTALDVSNGYSDNGTNIQLYSYFDANNSAQLWKLNSVSTFSYDTYTVNSSNGINVRTGPSSGYSRVGAARNGISFEVTKTSGNWGYTGAIQCTNGWQAGWVCLDYCTKTSGNSNNSSYVSYNNYANISLDVPHYLQSDKRWRSKKLGTSKYSIWGYGCTITSVAMMYSYNNNCTVYPDEIMGSLKFTSNGSVYWQGIYDLGFSYTSGSNKAITQSLMKKIYNQLENGRPVMLGSYNSSGDEHWVVITGYSGSTSTFSASGFTINDPAYDHTNLQQHLDFVGKVKKIVY